MVYAPQDIITLPNLALSASDSPCVCSVFLLNYSRLSSLLLADGALAPCPCSCVPSATTGPFDIPSLLRYGNSQVRIRDKWAFRGSSAMFPPLSSLPTCTHLHCLSSSRLETVAGSQEVSALLWLLLCHTPSEWDQDRQQYLKSEEQVVTASRACPYTPAQSPKLPGRGDTLTSPFDLAPDCSFLNSSFCPLVGATGP